MPLPMPPEEAFLQAIAESPDGDAPRLAYAAWLEVHGDPRGEFIRVQCSLARLPADDPRHREAAGRAQALLHKHQRAWLGPLRGLVPRVCFRRGLVEEVH